MFLMTNGYTAADVEQLVRGAPVAAPTATASTARWR
jgi:hypothetical protein